MTSAIFWDEKFECSKCGHVDHKKHKIPEYIWRYLTIKTCDTSKEEKRLMLHWHHDYADSKKLVELLLKLDATHDIDVPSVAHGPEYRTDMSNFANKSFSSSWNYVGYNQAESQSYMVHDVDQHAGDDSVLPIPSDLFTSEAFNQYNVDQEDEVPADEAASAGDDEVGLDDDHLEKNFDYEMDPHSDSDFDHELYDDDGQPLVDSDNSTLIPWQEGCVYSEAQFNYLSAFASAYREARKALQHTKTGRDYKVVGRFKSSKSGFR